MSDSTNTTAQIIQPQVNGVAVTASSKPASPVKERVHSRPQNKAEWDAFWQVHGVMLYYMVVLFLAIWLLLDVWSGNFKLMHMFGVDTLMLQNPLLRTISYLVVGGLFGSILFQTRHLYRYYLGKTEKPYDYRWLGKYITAPWESSVMAVVVLCLIRGGLALFGGSTGGDVSSTNNFTALGTGALVGFGMRDVVGWVGNLVRMMFINDAKALVSDETENPVGERVLT